MAATSEDEETEALLAAWADSDTKIQVLVFFHRNPGIIETLEGLALRLGIPQETLRKEIAEHVRLGIVRLRDAGGRKVLVYDRHRNDEVERLIARRARRGDSEPEPC
ncbi:MAG: hypothetical protein HY556_02985 [Euryarchaeota archaeon]|nr:hypothetical protein [Euryarchaeota archaeon]